jgi:hypothetical protein
MGLTINTSDAGDAVAACEAQMRLMVDQLFLFLENR